MRRNPAIAGVESGFHGWPKRLVNSFTPVSGKFLSVGAWKLVMSANPAVLPRTPELERIPLGESQGRAPLCLVVDADASTRHFLHLLLHGVGVDTDELPHGKSIEASLHKREPDLVFLNVAPESSEAIETVIALGRRSYSGHVQLMGARGSAVMAHVKSIGEQHRLKMLSVLKKPFETSAILKILQELKLGDPPSIAGRIDLEEALNNNWIEFWYQPKIDLRKKQLVGVEAFARARHPTLGVLLPTAFMPGAQDSIVTALAELALTQSLNASRRFTEIGVNLRLAVNIPVPALVKLPLTEIIQTQRSKFEKWPGMIIDIPEEQIVSDLALANEMAKKLQPLDVLLAVDHFGRGCGSLARLKESPFAEFKIDRSFVTDAGPGSDKGNAPICKTIIDLAHNFGSVAVAIGIERACDALALTGMGCDHGQGFLLGQPMPEERFTSLLKQRTMTPVTTRTVQALRT
jgi:EAL domain-containing protein (putative c-di-GMP-specific phosphodiesterase class I)